MIRTVLGDPRFWILLALGAATSFAFTLALLLRRRDGAAPAGIPGPAILLGAVMFGLVAAGFVLFRWGGCVAALAMSLAGWLTVPLAGVLARRRR